MDWLALFFGVVVLLLLGDWARIEIRRRKELEARLRGLEEHERSRHERISSDLPSLADVLKRSFSERRAIKRSGTRFVERRSSITAPWGGRERRSALTDRRRFPSPGWRGRERRSLRRN